MNDTYKIIEIIDEFTVMVDYGTNDGAMENDQLNIITIGDPVKIDNIDYGTYDLIKGTLYIDTAYPKFSICRKYKQISTDLLNPISSFKRISFQKQKLETANANYSYRKLPKYTPIQIGDLVRIKKH